MNVSGTDLIDLRQELKRWDIHGLRVGFWLRDDDLIQASPRLDAMSEFLERFRLRALLSIIPALMEKTVPDVLTNRAHYLLCQHGLEHRNYEPPDSPKAEFGPTRPVAESIADVSAGRRLLSEAFGDRLAPIFVPPWNRFTHAVMLKLPALGISGLSSYTTQEKHAAIPGLTVRDVDIDVLNWERPQDDGVPVIPLQVLASRLAMILKHRRETDRSSAEPIGILTHHRAMSASAWDVVTALVKETLESGIADWQDPAALFGRN